MADNDIFRQSIPSCFHKPYDAAKGDASPQEFATLCGPALAKYFQAYGCPQFQAFCDLVAPWCVTGDQLPLGGDNYAQIERRCNALVQAVAGTPDATIVEYGTRVVLDLVFQAQTGNLPQGNVRELVAQRLCVEILQDTLLAKLDRTQVLERFETQHGGDTNAALDALFEWKEEAAVCLPTAVEPVAKKLAADPSGSTVRVRAVRMPKRSTEELLASFRMA